MAGIGKNDVRHLWTGDVNYLKSEFDEAPLQAIYSLCSRCGLPREEHPNTGTPFAEPKARPCRRPPAKNRRRTCRIA